MGALAAVFSKTGSNSIPKVVTMLKELTHRGVDHHGIATPDSVVLAKSIEDIGFKEFDSSSLALGHNLSRILLRDQPQPIQCKGFSFVFEGRFFPFSGSSETEVIQRLKIAPQNAIRLIEKLDGSYVFAIACPERVIVGRDALGINPLYYGETETTCAIASERKALWALGIKDAQSFPPGSLADINTSGFSFTSVRKVKRPPIQSKMKNAANRLKDLLLQSTMERVADLEEVAVAFSGGLDSSVIAMLAKICGKSIHLISVGLEGQPEIQLAEKAAKALGLPLHLQTYSLIDVEMALPKVVWLIEEPDFMKAAIGIPFYWTAAVASELGYNILFAGQGSDELFGGYQRYLRDYVEGGAGAVQNAMHRDIALSYKRNFQRDNQICSFHKVELRLPFGDNEVTSFSLSLPVNLKIESAEDNLRKRVLRHVARKLGLPRFIVYSVKRAIQYGTGVDRALRKLARSRGLTPQQYVRGVFEEACSEYYSFEHLY